MPKVDYIMKSLVHVYLQCLLSNTRDGSSCPLMSKITWSQLSTLQKLDGTSCPPWYNWMVPVVHLCQKWHGTSCPWYQLSYIRVKMQQKHNADSVSYVLSSWQTMYIAAQTAPLNNSDGSGNSCRTWRTLPNMW